ncbi:hypothetical protein UA08_00989 [Talaromyces atroroseus]|uniref:Uncharacterized protein n=1 Tax=Talaromyces atroroseus TaxID=1441469 RepID=A0A225BCW7_TALAT|nr:hypothetical protein UA08_00989 [Talaromyces atroroseus]OKL63887.1 hypothetical protein UA08_00989 [Talaromyces atroroseus]
MAASQDSSENFHWAVNDDLLRVPTHQDFSVGEEIPKPLYSNVFGRVDLTNEGFRTQANITSEGRVDIDIDEPTSRLRSIFKLPAFGAHSRAATISTPVPPSLVRGGEKKLPPLNIVIQVVGSRGDVQPFVALGRVLKSIHGHRVRLATHSSFQAFVEENGLEFFSIGGDPMKLMAFMVKNPGLMPGFDALKNGDIHERRVEIATIISGCWRSCFEAGDGTGVPVSDRNADLRNFHGKSAPFVADAIIANPPSFAHIHCAEKLGIPLHMMFTMPWSPTQDFSHPLASISRSNADAGITNYVSYAIVEMMTWQGLGDIINRFREKSLGLAPISIMWAPSMISRLKIPHTYCWSPALIPKPNDWGSHIDISGFFFLSLASNYTPPDDLAAFLAAGPPPIYIGFGSIVVDDPNHMTRLIFDAVRLAGCRALVSKGWGGLGAEELGVPEGVFMLGNCPHDWLFQRVSCVVHHGGAGTTAAGIAAGRSTVIIPFFGDQPFWGAMVAKAGAGPKPIPYKQLTAEKLATAISQALEPTTSEKAALLAGIIEAERGTDVGACSFQSHLNVDKMRCSLDPNRTAVFRIKRTQIRLSALAFSILNAERKLDLEDVKLYRPQEYMTEPEPSDPIIGGGAAMLDSIEEFIMGFADLSMDVKRSLNTRISRSGSQSPASTYRRSLSNSRMSSPVTVTRFKVDSDKDAVQSPIETMPQSTDTSASSHVPKSTRPATVPADGGLPEDHDQTEAESSETQHVQEVYTRKHARTISDIRDLDLDGLVGTARSAAKLVNVGLRVPAAFTMAVAKGFHNTPLLYGDETVREQSKVTGIKSGLKAAGKEFGYGLYDGISGLATQPIQGAKKEGAAGAIKGFSKGIGGLILKPVGGAWALTGYTMSGIYQEIQKRFGESVENYIIASRCAQGLLDLSNSTADEKKHILQNWAFVEEEVMVKKSARHSRGRSLDGNPERSREIKENKASIGERWRREPTKTNYRKLISELLHGRDDSSSPTALDAGLPDEYEHTIRHSVAVTSQGNETEDEMIERALRASMKELRAAQAAGEEEERAYDLAVKASIREAEHVLAEKKEEKEHQSADQIASSNPYESQSIDKPNQNQQQRGPPPELPPRGRAPDAYDSELQNALNASQRSYEDSLRREQREKEEMDIVMEFVRRQSLAELEHNKRRGEAEQEKATER